jgi:hypothetical protein
VKIIIAIMICVALFPYCKAQSTEHAKFNLDTLLINKNDSRFFEAAYDSKNIIRLREVLNITDSSKTISIQCTFSNGSGTILKIFNPFAEQLVYKAELYSYKKKDYLETSTVPVFPKIISYETWPYKIDQIRLSGFKLVKSD